jgi:SOS-response transcriptional repressor LexA
MNLEGLTKRELAEGLSEDELASAIGVPVQTIADIMAGKLPQNPVLWEQFARYFRIHVDFLRYGGPLESEGLFDLSENIHFSSLGEMRKAPLLRWHQINQMLIHEEPPRLIHAETLLETDVPGRRTFAMQVRDDSMRPLFSDGEVFFVNPDLSPEPGHYVVVESEDSRPERALLRQLKNIDGHMILYPLNRRYTDLPLTNQQRIWGRVVQLRKNF